jgi:hypothetical protein
MSEIGIWRARSNEVILKVLAETWGQPEREIKKALLDAYPFGERKYYPYKIWCEQIKQCRKEYPAYRAQMQMFKEKP